MSTDGTEDFIKTLDAPFYWLFEKDLGIYDAMNKGILKAKGDWLYFLGCDDRLFEKSILQEVFNNLQLYPKKVDLIIGRVLYDMQGKESYFIKKNNGIVISRISQKLWLRNTLHHQSVFYNKKVFEARKYSLKYKILSDYDLNIGLLKNGVSELIIDNIVAVCKTTGLSKKHVWNLYKEEIALKTENSSVFLKPLFYMLSLIKYIMKKKI